jgi:hypothetical protein
MPKEILDNDFSHICIDNFHDEVFIGIWKHQNKYPLKVVKIVNEQLNKRKVDLTHLAEIQNESSYPKVSIRNWISSNPIKFSLLILMSLFVRYQIGIVVLFMFYIVYQLTEENKAIIWKKTNWILVNLIIIIILFSFFL